MLAATATTVAATTAAAGWTEPAPLIAFSFGNVALIELQRSPSQKQFSVARTFNKVVWVQSPTLSSVSPHMNVGNSPKNVSENLRNEITEGI